MVYNVPKDCQVDNLSEIYETYFGYPSKGYFVEVGAYDGEFVSNTSFLADLGWNGLYIEPITEYYQKCLERHKNNDVIVANVAIGLSEGQVSIFKGETLTTLNQDQVSRYKEMDWAKNINFHEDTCYQMRLDTLMTQMNVPKKFDILVVDVEGKESEIFQTFDLKEWRPSLIIVELEDGHPSFQKYPEYIKEIVELREYIANQEYVEVSKNQWNTVFVSKEL